MRIEGAQRTGGRRRSIRLAGYDYAQDGIYLVTVCSHGRRRLFGEVREADVCLSEAGKLVREEWLRTERIRPRVCLDAFVVMPDHVHGVVILRSRGTGMRGEPRGGKSTPPRPGEKFACPSSGSLPTIIRSFKVAVTRQIHELAAVPGRPVWQRGYFERVLRGEGELERARLYIAGNPARWREGADRRRER